MEQVLYVSLFLSNFLLCFFDYTYIPLSDYVNNDHGKLKESTVCILAQGSQSPSLQMRTQKYSEAEKRSKLLEIV